MKALKEAGSRTMAQDESTSIVFGMPKAAYDRGGAERYVPLHKISQTILNLLAEKK
jgi:two-component system chemotaxis response regulator CheB